MYIIISMISLLRKECLANCKLLTTRLSRLNALLGAMSHALDKNKDTIHPQLCDDWWTGLMNNGISSQH